MTVFDSKLGLRVMVCCLAASLSAGCAYLNQSRDRVEPVAVPHMRHAQMLNPDAGRNQKVVSGLDANAAKHVGEAYATSFERTDAQKDSTEGFQGLQGLGSD